MRWRIRRRARTCKKPSRASSSRCQRNVGKIVSIDLSTNALHPTVYPLLLTTIQGIALHSINLAHNKLRATGEEIVPCGKLMVI